MFFISTLILGLCSVGHELTQMSFNSRVNSYSFIVSCEFKLTPPKECEL